MIRIKDLNDEDSYKKLLHIESMICISEPNRWHMHFGGIGVDRYFFGNGKNDIYIYGKLIYDDSKLIGYALVYRDDFYYNVWLLPQSKAHIEEVIQLIETMFEKGHVITTNCTDKDVIKLMQTKGYKNNGESKYTAVLDLTSYKQEEILWDGEEIRLFKRDDITERVRYAALPTGNEITNEMYLDYMSSDDARNVIDYVVVDKNTDKMIGYYSWWLDVTSNTAMLNPVACIESHRKKGVSKRAILHGLNHLKVIGMNYAYVDTGSNNLAAISLYSSVGFLKCNTFLEMSKLI
ncbi:MAG TPA: GNAT family N-acetyltransferase [Lachnospiraceae bacterium]|nr:GNAT family N-acetyltransferase [Lachnospiraceae bacterium]